MNKRDQAIKDTQEDWRELGFFYELDEESKRWNISGSIAGLLKLCKILEDYVLDPMEWANNIKE